MADKVICPECKSTRTWQKGLVPSRTGPKQRYVCFTCGRTFYKTKAEPKPRVKPAKPMATKKSKTSKKKAG